MATSKDFNPKVREIIDDAFEYLGIDPQDLEDQALRSARRSLNTLLAEWIGDFTPLWLCRPITFKTGGISKPTSQVIPTDTSLPSWELVDDMGKTWNSQTAMERSGKWFRWAVVLPDGTEDIRALSIRIDGSGSFPVPLARMSAEDWNDYPIRNAGLRTDDGELIEPDPRGQTNTGQPYWYWMRRIDPKPLLYLIFEPDRPYDFDAVLVQSPNAVLTSNETLDIPRRWQSAAVMGLAFKLALKSAPDRVGMLAQEYQRALNLAKMGEDDGVGIQYDHQMWSID